MSGNKVYVRVNVSFTLEGEMIPQSIPGPTEECTKSTDCSAYG